MDKKTHIDGLSASLSCLGHPFTWLSIALLLLNDHLLKTVAPGWLTGKLSDLAGLFFFPFVLAAGLSLLPQPRPGPGTGRPPACQIGRIAFILTGVCFALLKTAPPANAFSAELVSRLRGFPAQFVLDPTDLLALGALWPAWRLWNRPRQTRPGRAAWIALAIGSLASLASPPAMEPYHVSRLAHVDDVLYASDKSLSFVAQSKDGGCTWETMVEEAKRAPVDFRDVWLPLEVCYPEAPQHCYRISGREEIEVSGDGGRSWQTAWAIPAGRRAFMQRFVERFQATPGQVNTVPQDMLFFEQAGSFYLLVAMDQQGVMRRRMPDGDWERYATERAHPIPYVAQNAAEMLIPVEREVSLWVGVAFLVLLGGCLVGWHTILEQPDLSDEQRRLRWWVLVPTLALVVPGLLIFLVCVIAYLYIGYHLGWPASRTHNPIPIAVVCFPLGLELLAPLGLSRTWRRLAQITRQPLNSRALTGWCVLTSLGVLLLGTAPWALWSLGVITFYEHALLLSAALSVAIAAGGLYGIRRVARPASLP